MFQHLVLHKPLAILDLETTGLSVQTDRIVEISILKITPDGRHEQLTHRVNPGIPISPGATEKHKLKDVDVLLEPSFDQLAPQIQAFLEDCDLCGYNFQDFDLRLLCNEFKRVSLPFSLEGRVVLDVMKIFHEREKRDLAAAVRFYCDREHAGPHSASFDVRETAEVFDAMLGRYVDLPATINGLSQHFKDPNAVDSAGKFVRVEGEIRFAFSDYRGQPLDAVARREPGFLRWILKKDFPYDVKNIVKDALRRAADEARLAHSLITVERE